MIGIGQEIQCLPYAGFFCKWLSLNQSLMAVLETQNLEYPQCWKQAMNLGSLQWFTHSSATGPVDKVQPDNCKQTQSGRLQMYSSQSQPIALPGNLDS